MRHRSRSAGEMRRALAAMDGRDALLDDSTAERLLRGQLDLDDTPPRYRSVARAIELLTAVPTAEELAAEPEAVAAIARGVERKPVCHADRPRKAIATQRVAQLAAACMVGAVSLLGGLAAANALPRGAQRVVSDMLNRVGVPVPAPDNSSGTGPAHSQASDTPAVSDSDRALPRPATNPPATAVDNRVADSGAAAASSESSQPDDTDAVTPTTVPVPAPKRADAATADAAGGHSTVGTSTAAADSDGRSVNRSANAATGSSRTP